MRGALTPLTWPFCWPWSPPSSLEGFWVLSGIDGKGTHYLIHPAAAGAGGEGDATTLPCPPASHSAARIWAPPEHPRCCSPTRYLSSPKAERMPAAEPGCATRAVLPTVGFGSRVGFEGGSPAAFTSTPTTPIHPPMQSHLTPPSLHQPHRLHKIPPTAPQPGAHFPGFSAKAGVSPFCVCAHVCVCLSPPLPR